MYLLPVDTGPVEPQSPLKLPTYEYTGILGVWSVHVQQYAHVQTEWSQYCTSINGTITDHVDSAAILQNHEMELTSWRARAFFTLPRRRTASSVSPCSAVTVPSEGNSTFSSFLWSKRGMILLLCCAVCAVRYVPLLHW